MSMPSLAAVQAADAMLDAICGPDPSPEGSDARLTQVLMAWRHEVDTEPKTQLVDTDTALAVVARNRPGRLQRLMAVLRRAWRGGWR